MGTEGELRVVKVGGTHHDVGFELGSACKSEATALQSAYRNSLHRSGHPWEGALRYARRVIPFIEEFHADFLEEIEGYGEALGVHPDEVVAPWSGYPTVASSRGCTDVAVGPAHTADGSTLVGHNEDYYMDYADTVVAVHVKPQGKPAFFALSYGGLFPCMGLNDQGISLTGNGMSPNDTRLGLPKMFPPRKVMEAHGIVDALRYSMPGSRGDSYNNIVCSAEGELYSMEGSATSFAAIYGEGGYLVHTNHYLHPTMVRFEEDLQDCLSSIVRYNRAEGRVKEELGRVTVDAIGGIFSDHVGYPDGICRHPNPKSLEGNQIQTNWSGIIDLTHRRAWICRGNPCGGAYLPYSLQA